MHIRWPSLHFFGLCAFAFAQPVFDLFGRNAEFFVSRNASAGGIAIFAIALVILPPLACAVLLAAARRFSAPCGRLVDLALVTTLLALTALVPLLRSGLPEALALATALALGIGGAAAYVGIQPVRSLFRLLALAPILFAVGFLRGNEIGKLVFEADGSGVATARVDGDVPIVLVILDELPLTSLLAADGAIDASRFPGFAELAATATWYRNAVTVSSRTNLAVPAILTGRYPPPEKKLPIRSDHPENLFSLLDGHYTMHVTETESVLHSETTPRRAKPASSLVSDVSILYLHMILPEGLREDLPSVSEAWGGFGGASPDPPPERSAKEEHATLKQRRLPEGNDARTAAAAFESLIESIAPLPEDSRRILYFIHVKLPHSAWKLLEDGQSYRPYRRYGFKHDRWSRDPWWSTDGYRRHLLQTMATDRLVQRLLERLRATAVFDPALVVLTSDHGASFWPGETFRKSKGSSHPEDLLRVPMLIKLPFQDVGEVDDRVVEIIDLLPTMAEAAGASLPWFTDGCSLLRDDCSGRDSLRLYAESLASKPFSSNFSADVLRNPATLERKIELFGAEDGSVGLYRAGHGEGLVGLRVADLPQRPGRGGAVRLDSALRSTLDGRMSSAAPARIVGSLIDRENAARRAHVAIAVRGVIRAVVPAPSDGVKGPRVAAMLPHDERPKSAGELALYEVLGESGATALVPLTLR